MVGSTSNLRVFHKTKNGLLKFNFDLKYSHIEISADHLLTYRHLFDHRNIGKSENGQKPPVKTLRELLGVQDKKILFTPFDIFDFSVSAVKAGLRVNTKSGMTTVSVDEYLRMAGLLEPDFLLTFSSNRIRPEKMIARSKTMADDMIKKFIEIRKNTKEFQNTKILAAIPFLENDKNLTKYFHHVKDLQPDGYALNCFDSNFSDEQKIDLIKKLAKLNTEKKLIFILGLDTPQSLFAISKMDLLRQNELTAIVSNYSAALTSKNLAIHINSEKSETEKPENERNSPFKGRLELLKADSAPPNSKGPLAGGCACETCRRHSRGYVSHLLGLNELCGRMYLDRHITAAYAEIAARCGWQ